MSNNSPIDKNKFPGILDALHQEHWHLTKLLVLLIVICIASLGSISLAQNFLPTGPIVTATPIPGYTDGQCDANPETMSKRYVPLPQPKSSNVSPTPSNASPTPSKTSPAMPTANANKKHSSSGTSHTTNGFNEPGMETRGMTLLSLANPQAKSTPTPTPPHTPTPTLTPNPMPTPMAIAVPPDWSTYGFQNDDAAYVAACAALFVQLYHTFRFNDRSTYEAALYMTSKLAQQHFDQGGPDDKNDIHARKVTEKSMQDNQIIELPTVAQPTIHDITQYNQLYIATVTVDYILDKQELGLLTKHPLSDTITLQTTPNPSKALPNQKWGWQVTDWKDADA
ncbi:MAG TPA: hypothetical protein VN207_08640 [Ktedonobacteraceae bacterium]|nr:hypothetical protein [Ktedonobacteraceae bacterium]